jgi:hypothetical protein
MIQILEIWTNDAGTEYAAKISGHRFFLKATDPNAKYTRIVYAAPYLEGHVEELRSQLERLVEQGSYQSDDLMSSSSSSNNNPARRPEGV